MKIEFGNIILYYLAYKAKFVYDGWVNGGPKVQFLTALILAGSMDTHSRNGLKRFSSQT